MKVRLSILKEYLHRIMVESRVDDVREQFPDMEEDVFREIVANQPSGSNNKYLMWTCKQVDALMQNDEDRMAITNVIQAVRLFDGNQQRLKQRDLNQYKDVDAVDAAIAELGTKKTKSQEQKQARADTDVIYQDDKFVVVRPHTAEASCKYGTGTKWCIAATASRNYFGTYSESNNKFYFVIDKTLGSENTASKFAIAIISDSSIQIYNAADSRVPLDTVEKHVGDKWPEIWQKIEAHTKAHPKTREVEEAEKATEEHVKALLKGDKLGENALKKVASDGVLTTPVVAALLKHFDDYNGPTDYRDPRGDIAAKLANRAADMPGPAAMQVIKWISSMKAGGGSGMHSADYYLEKLFEHAPLSPHEFRALAKTEDERVLATVFSNPNTPTDVKDSIAAMVTKFKIDEARRKVYLSLIRTGNITAEQMKDAISDRGSGYYDITSQLLRDPTLGSKLSPELISMIPIRNAKDFKELLKLPNVSPDHASKVLSKLMSAGSIEKYDLYQILKTIKLSADDIEKLWSDHPNQPTRTSLLQNPAVGATTASKFAKSKNSAYRFAVAHNTVTPTDDLITLANDESASTRQAVAANIYTPHETLLKLAKDETNVVRASVASNTQTPEHILKALKRDSDDFVKKAASKTLKSLTLAVEYVQIMRGMRSLLLEELADDDETPDTMNPSWRSLPSRTLDDAEFIAVFLLQNNGHASREEIQSAYQDFKGISGHGDLWAKPDSYSDRIVRGTSASSKGWYWSPPGINKGAVFRLTPAGASAAMDVLGRFREHPEVTTPSQEITSKSARAGKTYYTVSDTHEAFDVTGYEKGELTIEEVQAGYNGRPVTTNGKYTRLHPNRARYARRQTRAVKVFKYTAPDGETKHIDTFPKVSLPAGTAVTYVKAFYGMKPSNATNGYGQPNKAIVKYGDQTLLISFPLLPAPVGAEPPAKEPNVAPPVKKSPPPRELTGEPAPARPAGEPRGPKTTYKIYGKFKGHPVSTRLKGQAYVGPQDSQFHSGEQAVISPGEGNKLKVKKADSDHTQDWDPIDG